MRSVVVRVSWPNSYICERKSISGAPNLTFSLWSSALSLVRLLLSGSLSKSGPLDSGTKNNFPSFCVSEKGLAHIYKKAIYYFPVSYFCFATSQNWILADLRLPTVIRKVKFTDFVKRTTSSKMQLAEFRSHTTFKVHSLLWLTKYGNSSENSKLTTRAGRHPTLRPLFAY